MGDEKIENFSFLRKIRKILIWKIFFENQLSDLFSSGSEGSVDSRETEEEETTSENKGSWSECPAASYVQR